MKRRLRSPLRPAILALASLCAAARPGAHAAVTPPLFDCNGNGVEDAVDIALGASPDANQNGIPDECEPAVGPRAARPEGRRARGRLEAPGPRQNE